MKLKFLLAIETSLILFLGLFLFAPAADAYTNTADGNDVTISFSGGEVASLCNPAVTEATITAYKIIIWDGSQNVYSPATPVATTEVTMTLANGTYTAGAHQLQCLSAGNTNEGNAPLSGISEYTLPVAPPAPVQGTVSTTFPNLAVSFDDLSWCSSGYYLLYLDYGEGFMSSAIYPTSENPLTMLADENGDIQFGTYETTGHEVYCVTSDVDPNPIATRILNLSQGFTIPLVSGSVAGAFLPLPGAVEMISSTTPVAAEIFPSFMGAGWLVLGVLVAVLTVGLVIGVFGKGAKATLKYRR